MADIVDRLENYRYPLPSGKAVRPEVCEDAAAEITRLRAALHDIYNMHKGDQPAAFNVDDLAWADRHIMTMRLAAKAALSPELETQ